MVSPRSTTTCAMRIGMPVDTVLACRSCTAKANVQVAATALGGRDFEGQATKEINGKTVMSWGIVDGSPEACFTSVVGHR